MNAKSPSKHQHTPGPWHLGMKPGPIVYGPLGEQLALPEIMLLPVGERIANAHLIVAAPELLAVLKDIVFFGTCQGQRLDNAKAAIAKAEGESNV